MVQQAQKRRQKIRGKKIILKGSILIFLFDLRHDESWCRATLYRLDLEQPFCIALTVEAARFSGKWPFGLPARSRNRPSTALWGTCRCQGGNDDEQKDARFHGAEDFIDK